MRIKILLFLIFCSVILFFSLPKHHAVSDPRPVVEAVSVLVQPMPQLLEAPGIVEADRRVSIISQVTGSIQKIAFEEGSQLKKGQLLFEIDPQPLREKLHQATAALERDEMILAQNKKDAVRMRALAESDYVSKQQAELAALTLRGQAALVLEDYAQVQQAKIQLGYATITAPIDGLSGALRSKVGDLVLANDSNPLLTINAMDSLLVDFRVSQDQLQAIRRAQDKNPLLVRVQVGTEKAQSLAGSLVFIDNSIDLNTGTVLLKARIPNPEHLLWPGMMLQVSLVLHTDLQAITVPMTALQMDQKGHFVYTIDQGILGVQYVNFARQVEDWAVISQGLQGGEQVLIRVPPNVSAGSAVRLLPQTGAMCAVPAVSAAS